MASRPTLELSVVPLPQYPASERSPEEVLRDTDDFFAGQGPVHSTLRRLATRLDREGIPYAIIGAMALNLLGYARQTAAVDVFLSSEGLERFRDCFVELSLPAELADSLDANVQREYRCLCPKAPRARLSPRKQRIVRPLLSPFLILQSCKTEPVRSSQQ